MTRDTTLLHLLIEASAQSAPNTAALYDELGSLDYAALAQRVDQIADFLATITIERGDRVAVYLDKRRETVFAAFGAASHGAIFVPINPVLKAEQVRHILRDCGVRVLVTSPDRLQAIAPAVADCHELRHIVVTGGVDPGFRVPAIAVHPWSAVEAAPAGRHHRVVDKDIAAVLYTSGSTGKPKGVVLSHRNMVAGAKSVASYLENRRDDVLLAALPLSFDAGFSQLTTAFHAGASVALLNYLFPRDVVDAVARYRVTGLTAVPPLWIQLTQVKWPETTGNSLRYFANTGGRMPLATLRQLRALMPRAKPYLMYGLTEAFRATYLPPEEVDRRPDSIGKAIPNSEILVLRPDGTPCEPDEPGELVQRGALVAQGYWNDPEKTAERFRVVPGRNPALMLPEMAVFSGDTVRKDAEGFLYFIGRKDEMIKSSGYRISPSEVEEAVYATQLVGECAAFGLPSETLGEVVAVVVTARDDRAVDTALALAQLRERLPAYMVPARIEVWPGPLPRNANGKIDRKTIASGFIGATTKVTA